MSKPDGPERASPTEARAGTRPEQQSATADATRSSEKADAATAGGGAVGLSVLSGYVGAADAANGPDRESLHLSDGLDVPSIAEEPVAAANIPLPGAPGSDGAPEVTDPDGTTDGSRSAADFPGPPLVAATAAGEVAAPPGPVTIPNVAGETAAPTIRIDARNPASEATGSDKARTEPARSDVRPAPDGTTRPADTGPAPDALSLAPDVDAPPQVTPSASDLPSLPKGTPTNAPGKVQIPTAEEDLPNDPDGPVAADAPSGDDDDTAAPAETPNGPTTPADTPDVTDALTPPPDAAPEAEAPPAVTPDVTDALTPPPDAAPEAEAPPAITGITLPEAEAPPAITGITLPEAEAPPAVTGITLTNARVTETVADGGTIAKAHDPAGTVVGRLVAIGGPTGATHGFEIVDDASGLFEIDGDLLRLREGAVLDADARDAFDISVGIPGEPDATMTLRIDVKDFSGSHAVSDPDGAAVLGTSEEDRIDGGGGADTIDGGAGDDTILAGAGDDLIDGGAGDDVLLSGAGDDTIRVMDGAGSDEAVGGFWRRPSGPERPLGRHGGGLRAGHGGHGGHGPKRTGRRRLRRLREDRHRHGR